MERRYISGNLEPQESKLVGYAAVFESPTEIKDATGRGFNEVIKRGAFRNALQSSSDVVALFNHKEEFLLGRTSSGTLSLKEDIHGLRMEIDLPNTPTGNEVRELTRRGDLKGCSFAFTVRPQGDQWRMEGGKALRELRDLNLHDVSVVVNPAYNSTSLNLRSNIFLGTRLHSYKLQLRQLQNGGK